MTDEEIVAALAEELRAARGAREDDEGVWSYPLTLLPDELATALLPVVRHIAEQRAAAELLAAAREDGVSTHKLTPVEVLTLRVVKLEALFARAAALTATPEHGKDATT